MKSLKYVVAASIAASALPGTALAAQVVTTGASATTVQVATIDQGANNSFTIGFSDANLTNPSFNELLTFTTDVMGVLNLRVDTTATSDLNNVTFSNVFLTGTGITGSLALTQALLDPNDTFLRNFIPVGAGTFTLNILGTPGTQNGAFGGVVSFASTPAVPEPGTWAMMLLGFGGIGFAMRRRRRQQGAYIYQAA